MDARPELGSTEVWEPSANADHPVHLRLVRFKMLSRNSDEPRPRDAGWNGTVDLGHGAKAR